MLDSEHTSAVQVLVPLLNPNEPEARVVSLNIISGQRVAKGDLLFTLETTKSTADVTAENGGFVLHLQISEGQIVNAGEIACFLADSPDWSPPETGSIPEGKPPTKPLFGPEAEIPEGLRISQPALALARRESLDLSTLPAGPLITEKWIREILDQAGRTEEVFRDIDPAGILIYGGGGHAKTLIDLIRLQGTYSIAGILDDGIAPNTHVMGIPVLGGGEKLPDIFNRGIRLAANAVGGIGNVNIRIKIFERLVQAGLACPTLVHPTAFIEPSARLSEGIQVLSQAYIGSEAELGFGVIANTGSVISHDCKLGDFVNVSPGALIAGAVHIGSGALVGMGVTVNLGVQVGPNARIGNGATIKEDVPENGIVKAGTIWPG
jgi:sugar O-acyltransferase (sialic acid O-acetyltransferase NeuD family)